MTFDEKCPQMNTDCDDAFPSTVPQLLTLYAWQFIDWSIDWSINHSTLGLLFCIRSVPYLIKYALICINTFPEQKSEH